MKTCIICNETKPLTDFSTLTRQSSTKSQPDDKSCTTCYWNQLVLVYPAHSLDGVTYLPHDKPQTQYIPQMEKWLLKWVRNKEIIKAYSVLGEIEEQIRPFREFVKGMGLT